jgi:4'-phosphopantetheinyl transferase
VQTVSSAASSCRQSRERAPARATPGLWGREVLKLSPSLLQPGAVHLFLAHPDSLLDAAPRHADWLSPKEREHAERYRQLGDTARYRATRVLVRGVLAGLLGRGPAELEFVEGAHGRPALLPGSGPLDFNASRSRAWVGLVVSPAGVSCGIDVEDVSRKTDVLAIARAFAPEERALLEAAAEKERRRHFFELWTLKEATLKALGTGLTLSLSACAFRLEPPGAPHVTFASTVADDAKAWSFTQMALDADHLVAVAVRSSEAPEFVFHLDAETCAAVARVR